MILSPRDWDAGIRSGLKWDSVYTEMILIRLPILLKQG